MLRSVMNKKPNEQHVKLVGQTTSIVKKWSGPAVSVISYGLIIGFALSGIGVMGASAFAWLFFHSGWFAGFGLLTGGVFLSVATALFLGKLTKAGDALYQNRHTQPSA